MLLFIYAIIAQIVTISQTIYGLHHLDGTSRTLIATVISVTAMLLCTFCTAASLSLLENDE